MTIQQNSCGSLLQSLAQIGGDFVCRGDNCALIIPSTIAPHDDNWLLNPSHGEIRKIAVLDADPLSYDSRMFWC